MCIRDSKSIGNCVIYFQYSPIRDTVLSRRNRAGTRLISGLLCCVCADKKRCSCDDCFFRIIIIFCVKSDFIFACFIAVSYTHLDVYKRQVGSRAVFMEGGDRNTLTSGENVITNNIIERFQQVKPTGAYGIEARGVGTLISHNVVRECNSIAILYFGNNHILEYNDCLLYTSRL